AIEAAMELYQGDRQAVADYLGISTTTLWRRLKNTKTQ
ncbi:MAG: Bacterial regulatory protein Fis family, partial [Pseudomonadota bacterium]